MLMGLPITPMGMAHRAGATPQRLAPDGALASIQALDPTAHERAQYDRRVLGAGPAEQRRHRQNDVARDPPLVEHRAHLADPVIHVAFGAPQAQRRLPAQRHPRGALAPLQATVCDVPHLGRIATRQPLGHQTSVVGGLGAWRGVSTRGPVLGKALLADAPVPRGWWHHRIAPSWGDDLLTVPRLYHASSASSTPHRPVPGHPSLASVILESGGLPGPEK
jgi:hypothetical protein